MRFFTYIESTGSQYIDTGFKPNSSTRLVIDFDVVASSAQCALFGSRTAFSKDSFNVFTGANNAGYQDDYGTASKTASGVTSSGRHTLDKNKNVFSVDGEAFNTSATQTFSGTFPIYLLTINNGGVAMTAYPTSAKLYSCQIYDNGDLVRDFVPAEDDSGNVGLWDKVNETFHPNIGSGSFAVGEVTQDTGGETFTLEIPNLTNGVTYYGKVFTVNHKERVNNRIDLPFFEVVPADGLDLAELPEGSIVMIRESGSPVEFYVAKHDYESGLNGSGRTLLVRKDCYDIRSYHSSQSNPYATSSIDSWLNGSYKVLLDAAVQTAIETTAFYCASGSDNGTVTTLKRNVFLLSLTELGAVYSNGVVLGTALPIANTLKIAYRNGSAVGQWTRTPMFGGSGSNVYRDLALTSSGSVNTADVTNSTTYGSRPAFTLPATTKLNLHPNADGSYSLFE